MSGNDEKPEKLVKKEKRDEFREAKREYLYWTQREVVHQRDIQYRRYNEAIAQSMITSQEMIRDMFSRYSYPRSRWARLKEWLKNVWKR